MFLLPALKSRLVALDPQRIAAGLSKPGGKKKENVVQKILEIVRRHRFASRHVWQRMHKLTPFLFITGVLAWW